MNETIDNYMQNLSNILKKYAPLKKSNKEERGSNKNLESQKNCVSIRKKLNIYEIHNMEK